MPPSQAALLQHGVQILSEGVELTQLEFGEA
jgi:hypothetical protein